jgi:hypothetical protein
MDDCLYLKNNTTEKIYKIFVDDNGDLSSEEVVE